MKAQSWAGDTCGCHDPFAPPKSLRAYPAHVCPRQPLCHSGTQAISPGNWAGQLRLSRYGLNITFSRGEVFSFFSRSLNGELWGNQVSSCRATSRLCSPCLRQPNTPCQAGERPVAISNPDWITLCMGWGGCSSGKRFASRARPNQNQAGDLRRCVEILVHVSTYQAI